VKQELLLEIGSGPPLGHFGADTLWLRYVLAIYFEIRKEKKNI
jgi:hypothetical protein